MVRRKIEVGMEKILYEEQIGRRDLDLCLLKSRDTPSGDVTAAGNHARRSLQNLSGYLLWAGTCDGY